MNRVNAGDQMDEGITDDQGISSKRRFSLVNDKENSEVCDPIGKTSKKDY